MNLKKIFLIFFVLISININAKEKELTSLIAPYDEWYFSFFYPKELPARVTYVELVDTDSILYKFRALDGTMQSPTTVGTWENNLHAGIPSFNKAKNPPQFMHFCWVSTIDKKIYETEITFGYPVWKMMLTPYPSVLDASKPDYHRFMLIGLAPEGKVRVWLENEKGPNISIRDDKSIIIKTISSDKMHELCRKVTRADFSRPYNDSTINFIKDKKYPYGTW